MTWLRVSFLISNGHPHLDDSFLLLSWIFKIINDMLLIASSAYILCILWYTMAVVLIFVDVVEQMVSRRHFITCYVTHYLGCFYKFYAIRNIMHLYTEYFNILLTNDSGHQCWVSSVQLEICISKKENFCTCTVYVLKVQSNLYIF